MVDDILENIEKALGTLERNWLWIIEESVELEVVDIRRNWRMDTEPDHNHNTSLPRIRSLLQLIMLNDRERDRDKSGDTEKIIQERLSRKDYPGKMTLLLV